MNSPSTFFVLLLFLQVMLVIGVMLGGIYLLSCLRRVAHALESLAQAAHTPTQTPSTSLAPPHTNPTIVNSSTSAPSLSSPTTASTLHESHVS